jgi:hypothetical protein
VELLESISDQGGACFKNFRERNDSILDSEN